MRGSGREGRASRQVSPLWILRIYTHAFFYTIYPILEGDTLLKTLDSTGAVRVVLINESKYIPGKPSNRGVSKATFYPL